MRSRKNIYTKNESGSFEYAGKTMYQYLGSQLAYQCTYNAAGAVDTEFYFFYDSYDKLTAIRYIKGSTDHYYYVTTNAQGDVLGIYSASGVLLASYEYDAWGNCSVISHNDNYTIGYDNPIRYRSYYYDSDTGLYYLQSRYYDPEIGRFINADGYITTGQGVLSFNMFAYCQNNPVMYSDPSGELHWLIYLGIGLIVACGVAGGVLGGLSDEKLAQKSFDKAEQEHKDKMPKDDIASNYVPINEAKEDSKNDLNETDPNSNSINVNQKLTTMDRVTNVFIGATLGLAAGGAVVTLVAIASMPFVGKTVAAPLFVMGALTFDAEAMIFGPLYFVTLDPIEWDS